MGSSPGWSILYPEEEEDRILKLEISKQLFYEFSLNRNDESLQAILCRWVVCAIVLTMF